MKPLRRQSLVEQTAQHLREGFRAGRWSGQLPGVLRLATELGVSKDTVRAALKLLENDGELKTPDAGKRRQIVLRRQSSAPRRALRVAILLRQLLPNQEAHTQRLILSIKHNIESAGHICVLGEQSLTGLGHKLKRIVRFIKATEADAWIVYAASRDVCEWFAKQAIPVLAIGSRSQGLPIAGSTTDMGRAMSDAVDALVEHGHRRIVLIAHTHWRLPTPSPGPQAFLSRLRHHGIPSGDYNLPAWDETPDGFEKLMESLFGYTPPTALLFAHPTHCVAALTFLARRSLQVPRDISLVNILPDPVFSLHRPVFAHFEWPIPPHVHRATRWAASVARDNADHKTTFCHAKFAPGETIGPARK